MNEQLIDYFIEKSDKALQYSLQRIKKNYKNKTFVRQY
jgi:hypothetical protein